MPKSSVAKICDICPNLVAIRYRIQDDDSGKWYLVCPDCWQQFSKNNLHYRYGGTWKANK